MRIPSRQIAALLIAILLADVCLAKKEPPCDFSALSYHREVADSFDGDLDLKKKDQTELNRIWNQNKTDAEKIKETFFLYVTVRLRGYPKSVRDHVLRVLDRSGILEGTTVHPRLQRRHESVGDPVFYSADTESIYCELPDGPNAGYQMARYSALAHEVEHAIQHKLGKNYDLDRGEYMPDVSYNKFGTDLASGFLSEKSAISGEHAFFHLVPGGTGMLRSEIESAAATEGFPPEAYARLLAKGEIAPTEGRSNSRILGTLYGLTKNVGTRDYLRYQWGRSRYGLSKLRRSETEDAVSHLSTELNDKVGDWFELRTGNPKEAKESRTEVLKQLDEGLDDLRTQQKDLGDILEHHISAAESSNDAARMTFNRVLGDVSARKGILDDAIEHLERLKASVENAEVAVPKKPKRELVAP